jgi:cold shock CspA family protein
MQATVSSFDPTTRGGAVLLDDGVELPFDGAALSRTELRLLRPGQRVRIDVTGAGAQTRVRALQILTLT